MPRVILVIGSVSCGGAERALVDMANFWKASGWEVTIATWSHSVAQDFYPVARGIERVALEIDCAKPSASRFKTLSRMIGCMMRLRRLIVNRKPDAVLSFIDASNVLTLLASYKLRARVIVSERTSPGQHTTISPLWSFLRPLTYRWASVVVAQTQDAARWLEQHCKVLALVVPNPIRQMPHLEVGRSPLILAIGRLSAEKGVDTLLRAFAMVSEKFPNWRVVIAGDGPERPALMDLREKLNLATKVEFIGQVHEVEPWLASASLFVHASRREGFPNALLEAMAMGTPVICTDCRSGPSEIIQDRVNGILIPVDDVRAFSEAMTELIEDADLRDRLASEGLKVRESYEQSTIMKRWTAIMTGVGL